MGKKTTVSKRILKEHIESHVPTDRFDYYCVATHGSDYEPKYISDVGGEICHDGMGDGYCSDYCRQCPVPCPVPNCNTKDDPYFAEYWED